MPARGLHRRSREEALMINAARKLASLAAAAVGTFVVAVAVGAVGVRPVTGAITLPPLNTTIVNTAANPVPTSAVGTTQIAGAVSVSGTPTVNIGSGTVSVASSPASPLNVQEVAPRDPIGGIPINRALVGVPDGVIYVVPAGKVLILEQVYGQLNAASPLFIRFDGFRDPVRIATLLLVVSTPAGDGVTSYFNQQARAYFYPGEIVVHAIVPSDLWLTGRLVDAPQ
jgi:hypothetical protein